MDRDEEHAAIEHAVEGLLTSIPPEIADAVRLGAIPHWFNQELLSRLCGNQSDVARVVDYLRRFRFVRQDAQGRFRYHERVRDYLLTWWRQERPEQYQAANRCVLAHFSALVEDAERVERPVYEREVLYHQLIVDEVVGLRYLSARFEEACSRYRLGLAEEFVAQAAQLKDTLKDGSRMWVQYFEARLDLVYRRHDAGEAAFQDLAEHAHDSVLQAIARWSLGKIRVNQQRWSQAIKLYHDSLDILQPQRERALMYDARVMLSLGDAYRNLADTLGGLQPERTKLPGASSRFLYILQHLPFLIYRWLVRHVYFLPNWYFGTNYQDWIIAYLLTRSIRWYRRAERHLEEIGDTPCLAEARLSLAELEHQVGRWSRARRWYAVLAETDEIKSSRYRTAQARLGQGRAFLDEGALNKAERLLSKALETFRRFRDDASIGVTAALLGRLYASLGRLDEAMSVYVESAQAFEAVDDPLARTQVVWALEDLAQRSTPLDQPRQQQLAERHYITRFPDTLLRWFRRLALLGALPLTYVLTFIVGLALTLSLIIIESQIRWWQIGANVHTTVADALILTVFATLPALVALWLYRLIYGLLGVAFVRWLGRRLVPIERDQPSYLVADATGLTRHDVSKDLSHTVAWSDVTLQASIDYYLWRRPIDLISVMVLAADSGMVLMLDAITAGYGQLKQDITRHISRQRDGVKEQCLDFVVLEGRWTLAVIAACLAFALVLASTGKFPIRATDTLSGEEVILPLSSFMVLFLLTLLLVFPAVVLWRLVSHQVAIRSILKYQVKTIPLWVLWLAAPLCTVIAALWIILILLYLLENSG